MTNGELKEGRETETKFSPVNRKIEVAKPPPQLTPENIQAYLRELRIQARLLKRRQIEQDKFQALVREARARGIPIELIEKTLTESGIKIIREIDKLRKKLQASDFDSLLTRYNQLHRQLLSNRGKYADLLNWFNQQNRPVGQLMNVAFLFKQKREISDDYYRAYLSVSDTLDILEKCL